MCGWIGGTPPYKFYQFWMNVSDEDASSFIRIFTSLSREEIEASEAEHLEAPHKRTLQSKLLQRRLPLWYTLVRLRYCCGGFEYLIRQVVDSDIEEAR